MREDLPSTDWLTYIQDNRQRPEPLRQLRVSTIDDQT
jgi:hypothetical protein